MKRKKFKIVQPATIVNKLDKVLTFRMSDKHLSRGLQNISVNNWN